MIKSVIITVTGSDQLTNLLMYCYPNLSTTFRAGPAQSKN